MRPGALGLVLLLLDASSGSRHAVRRPPGTWRRRRPGRIDF
ncbi:MAG: hypothetical protein ACE5HD_11745 [Acidobacteriota bacterium]